MNEDRKVNVVFEPGCFDDFEGTQEELDELVLEINRMAESGELFENADELDENELNEISGSLNNSFPKTLQ